jgi:uncharacterized protein YbjT (DUF2867 family)
MVRFASWLLPCLLVAACEMPSEHQLVDDEPERTILVAGATGRQGGAVARALLAQGFSVRALTRDPDQPAAGELLDLGAEIMQGNFDDPASLERAMQGVYGAFSVTVPRAGGFEDEIRQGKAFATAARTAGVRHYIFTSVANADRNIGVPNFDSKHEVEIFIRDSGLPYTIVRPVTFMENWDNSKEQMITSGYRSPQSADRVHYFISVRDIGRIVATAFSNSADWIGREVDIAGDALTHRQVADTMSRVSGKQIRYVKISWAEFAKQMPDFVVQMERWYAKGGYDVDLAALQREFPGLVTVEAYLRASGWAPAVAEAENLN